MKLKDEYKGLPKEMIYDMYLALTDDCKDYDNITRGKMLDSIINQYSKEDFLFYVCTDRELEFLRKFDAVKLSIEDIEKYRWETEILNRKGIFSDILYEVYDEQKENVRKALLKKDDGAKKEKEVVMFMVSLVRIHASLLTNALLDIVGHFVKETSKENIEHLLSHPLFHYYCEFSKEYIELADDYFEKVSYRKYWDLLEDIESLKAEHLVVTKIDMDINNYYDIFYYGFPIKKEKVGKMYEEVMKSNIGYVLIDLVEEVRLLNNRGALKSIFHDDETLKIINEGLDDVPCAIYNGATPREYEEQISKRQEIIKKFDIEEQVDASLDEKDADLFYKLYFALLEYVNDSKKINKNIKKIYKQIGLNPNDLVDIDRYLWEHKDIIDEFIEENKYKFSSEELEIVSSFKNSLTSDRLVITGFTKEYTKVLDIETNKLYMVKGIRGNIDEIIDSNDIPVIVNTTLLMFKDNIIYNGFLSSFPIDLGNDFKEMILEEEGNAIKYYHL